MVIINACDATATGQSKDEHIKELQAKVKAFKDWHKANPDSHDAYCESRTQEMDMESMKWKGFPKCNCGLDELLAEDK